MEVEMYNYWWMNVFVLLECRMVTFVIVKDGSRSGGGGEGDMLQTSVIRIKVLAPHMGITYSQCHDYLDQNVKLDPINRHQASELVLQLSQMQLGAVIFKALYVGRWVEG